VFRTIAGLEVRCGYSDDDVIRSQYAIEIGTARALAADWRAAAVVKGFYDNVAKGVERCARADRQGNTRRVIRTYPPLP